MSHLTRVISIALVLVSSSAIPYGMAADGIKKLVVVHKNAGIPAVNQMADGVVNAGKEFGIDAKLIGPATQDAAQQVKLIEDVIAQGVEAIGVVPIDEKVTAAVLKRAQGAGIKVVTFEGPNQEGRDWNVDLVGTLNFGEVQMQRLAKEMGEKGEYVIFVGALTTPSHMQWADAAVAYQKKNYPNMKQVADRFPGGDEVDVAQRTTLDILKAYPNVTGILAEGSAGPIGAGNALRQTRMQKKVAIVGTCVASQAQAMLKNGTIRECMLWDPVVSGYSVVAVAKLLLDGATFTDGMQIGSLGKATIDPTKKSIQFNKILHITSENVDGLVARGL
ncbi:LacI family transcriptional regulator [Rhizobium sp. Root1203]|uniref:autoinducer 2 ABC transporter substrate-binding protein n=1 Tax=Rhizobium sp. Root1203 TaxID=1736427 RepID=UPI000709F68A|nr:autoinducer 2 ABC transporter substrate-binding protein [Rhizobium sp. Root1203]KQV14338.1 LacI family transcriptional regulator [Rhizobium sp. Root1203]